MAQQRISKKGAGRRRQKRRRARWLLFLLLLVAVPAVGAWAFLLTTALMQAPIQDNAAQAPSQDAAAPPPSPPRGRPPPNPNAQPPSGEQSARVDPADGAQSSSEQAVVVSRPEPVIADNRRPASRESAGPPPYPWPPEAPSSLAPLDRFVASARGRSLGALSEQMAGALVDAGYADHRFYSAPNGFVLVTRLEEISSDGAPLPGRTRYRLPRDPRGQSFAEYVRGLFLEAPPGYWRYIAIVVTDAAIVFDAQADLSSDDALQRLQEGATRFEGALAAAPFSPRHQVVALVYEFRKRRADEVARLVEPGRIPPEDHLRRTRLDGALSARFGGR